MKSFVVTYPIRLSTCSNYTRIQATSELEARLYLNRVLGSEGWGSIYADTEDTEAMIAKYGLTEIPLTHGLGVE